MAACCLLILIPCIVLPIVLRDDEEKYYSENEVLQEEISKDFLTQYFAENYSQYSFVLNECDISYMYGYYGNQSKELLAVSLELYRKDVPFTKIEFDLILTNRYQFKSHSLYTKDSTITDKNDYRLYYKEPEAMFGKELYGMLEYNKYKLYIHMNLNDTEFFEKFL